MAIVDISGQPIRGATVDKTNPLARGLVGYWPMLEGTGSTLGDYSGNDSHQILTNMSQGDWIAGKNGSSLNFNGSNQYASAPVVTNYPFTIAAWLKITTTGYIFALSINDPTKTVNQFYLGLWSPDLWCFKSRPPSWIGPEGPQNTGEWTHLVGTCEADGTGTLYVNGVFANSAAMEVPSNLTTIDLGRIGDSSPQYGQCEIGDVSTWDRILSPDEIQTLYSNPWALFAPRTITIPTVEVADITATNAYGSDSVSFDWTVNPA